MSQLVNNGIYIEIRNYFDDFNVWSYERFYDFCFDSLCVRRDWAAPHVVRHLKRNNNTCLSDDKLSTSYYCFRDQYQNNYQINGN